MSEQIRSIVESLNKLPFNKNYNIISFDALDNVQLLQILSDVIVEVDAKQKFDIRQENAGQTAVRVMQLLQLLRYQPAGGDSAEAMTAFRQGLVHGEKAHIYPLLEWLLQNLVELRTRAYLGHYLRKIEVPLDLLQDDELAALYSEYEGALEEFKVTHAQIEDLRSAGESTNEIRVDIENMEQEREQVSRRVERLKQKAGNHRAGVDGAGKLLELAREVRQERDREAQINQQKATLRSNIAHFEQRVHRTKQQLSEARQANAGSGAQRLLDRLQQSVSANGALADHDLPKDVNVAKRRLRSLQQMASEPAVSAGDVGNLRSRLSEAAADYNRLVEQRMAADSQEEQLSVFRQQASVVAGKRENVASKLLELRQDAAALESEFSSKVQQANVNAGDNVPARTNVATTAPKQFIGRTEDDLRAYATKLKVKNADFRQKRAVVNEQVAELGILTRTIEILKQRDEEAGNHLSMTESNRGVAGARATQERLEVISSKKADIDDDKGKALADMSDLVKRLNSRIAEKKAVLAPMLKEVRPLRQAVQELEALHTEKKSGYDAAAAAAAGNWAKLEQDVGRLREQLLNEQSRYYQIMATQSKLEINQERVADEMKYLTSADPQERKKSFRENISRRIGEAEQLGRLLREQQHELGGSGGDAAAKQVRLWRDVMRLVEAKIRTSPLSTGKAASSVGTANSSRKNAINGADTLVVQ